MIADIKFVVLRLHHRLTSPTCLLCCLDVKFHLFKKRHSETVSAFWKKRGAVIVDFLALVLFYFPPHTQEKFTRNYK